MSTPDKTGPIKVLTKDGILYELSNYLITETQLWGTGKSKKEGVEQAFEGTLDLADIDYVQVRKFSLGKTLLLAGVVVIVVGVFISAVTYEEPPPDTVSCPYAYSYDGNNYYLESETFSGSIFKGAERAAYDVLYHLKPVDGKYLLKLSNERSETQFVNEIKILVADVSPQINIIPDRRGVLHCISNPVLPIKCQELGGKNELASILKRDDYLWKSDLESKDFARDEDLLDGLVLEFPKPAGAYQGKLIVVGKNSNLGAFAFRKLFELKGENILRWYQQLNNDPNEQKKMLNWMKREGMLHVKVWQDGEWLEQASFLDPGPVVSKGQVVVLDLSKTTEDVVKLRLESATDLWQIDQVYMDYSPDAQVDIREIVPEKAIDESGQDVTDLLSRDDDLYYTSLKDQFAEISFAETPTNTDKKRIYILKSKGYYYHWTEGSGEEKAAVLDSVLMLPLFGSQKFMPAWKEAKLR